MVYRVVLLGCLVLGQVATVIAGESTYALDASHTSIIFGISHMGFSFTYGRFNKSTGQVVFDVENPAKIKLSIMIDPASIDSNDAKRDEHLRSPDFFNVKQFPKMEFHSVSLDASTPNWKLTGDLTIAGVTKRITVPLQKLGEGADPFGGYRIGFLSQFKIKRSDYGMKNMIGPVGDEVSITISFEGIRQ